MSYRFSPTRSPKRAFGEHQQRFQASANKRNSPGTLKKLHPYNNQDMNQSSVMEKAVLKHSLDELEFYKQKCRDLEYQLQGLDNHIQNVLNQSGQAELQINTFIKENNEMHGELEKLNKVLSQKRNEAELWKQKYENQLSQLMQVKANYELELQQLSQEVQRLLGKLDEYEFDKQRDVDQARISIETNQQRQYDKMKVSHVQHNDMLEQQVRKLRDVLDEKDIEIDDLQAKIERIRVEDDSEIQRILKDNENLRARINYIELDRQKELEQLRNKLEGYSHSTLDNLKKTHVNQIELLEGEIEKLRGLLEIKNAEIETLIQQNMKLKQNYEQQLGDLRLEVDCLKSKLLDNEHHYRAQLENLQQQLIEDHNEDMEHFKRNYENSIQTLENEINSLQSILENKNMETQQMMNEKSQQRDYYESQLNQVNCELDEAKQRQFDVEKEKNNEIDQLEEELQRYRMQSQEQKDQMKAQIQFLEGEIQRLKEISHQKNKELDSSIQQFSLIKRSLEEEIRTIKQDNDSLRQKVYESDRSRLVEIEELKQKNQSMDQFFREKCRQLEIRNENLVMEAKRAKEQLDIRQSDMDSYSHQRQAGDKEVRRLKDENEHLKNKVINTEREKLKDMEDLRNKLENSSVYQIENLKTAFNTQLNILHSENSDLKLLVDAKNRDIQELIEKYQSLEKAMTSGEFGPEAIANKNIYDVYIAEDKNQQLNVYENDDIGTLAKKFCQKYKVDLKLLPLIVQNINQNLKNQEEDSEEQSLPISKSQNQNDVYSRLYQHAVIKKQSSQTQSQNTQSQQEQAKRVQSSSHCDMMYKQGLHKQKEKEKICKLNNEIKSQEQLLECTYHPAINPTSKNLVQRTEKIEEHLIKYGQQLKLKMEQKKNNMEQHDEETFKPQINQISEIIVQKKRSQGDNLDIFQNLYYESKVKEAKLRKLQEEQQYSFQPKINEVSEMIMKMEKKPSIASPIRKLHQEDNFLFKPQTGRPPTMGRPQNLFATLYEQSKVRKDKQMELEQQMEIRKQEESIPVSGTESNKIMREKIMKSLCEIFKLLDGDEDGKIDQVRINKDALNSNQKRILNPLFEEMSNDQHTLRETEFIQSCLNLYQQLSVQQRHDLIFGKRETVVYKLQLIIFFQQQVTPKQSKPVKLAKSESSKNVSEFNSEMSKIMSNIKNPRKTISTRIQQMTSQ